jgi:hypothetical protein
MEFPIPLGHTKTEFPTPEEAQEAGLNPTPFEPENLSLQPTLKELTHGHVHHDSQDARTGIYKRRLVKEVYWNGNLVGFMAAISFVAGLFIKRTYG